MGDSWWLDATNAAMGIAVAICFAVVFAGAIASTLKKKHGRQERIRLEIRKF
jgi:hypothetical protein